MNEYRVIFEIDAEGKSPRDAAEYVYAKYFGRDPEAVDPDDACCFTVIDDEAGEGWSVDLAEDGAERLPASKAEPVNAQLHHALRIIMEDEHRLLPAERELGSAALAAAEQGAPTTIRLHIWNGVVEEPEGLPPGVKLIIKETDDNGIDGADGQDDNGDDYVIREFTG